MKELIKWIKRNISVSIVALCVSIISAYFAYNRYMAENGSEIKPVVFNKIDDEKEKTKKLTNFKLTNATWICKERIVILCQLTYKRFV